MLGPIIRLVMSGPSIYMMVPNVFVKLFLLKINIQQFLILKVRNGDHWESIALRWQYLKPFKHLQIELFVLDSITLKDLTVSKQIIDNK